MAAEDTRFGVDYSTFRPDGRPGLTYRRITGPRIPLEGVIRMWLTEIDDLPWAPNAGTVPPIHAMLNSAHDLNVLRKWQSFLTSAAKSVNFVRSANVSIRYVGTTLTINAQIALTTGGTYPLNVIASAVTGVIAQFPVA